MSFVAGMVSHSLNKLVQQTVKEANLGNYGARAVVMKHKSIRGSRTAPCVDKDTTLAL